MRDIFNDQEFEKMLYGGVHDLEEPVGRLVYNLWKAKIKTSWSCAGHVGKFICNSEKNAIVGYFAFDEGKLLYTPNQNSAVLTDKLEEVVRRNDHFARLERREQYQFYLSMDDIAVRFDNLERGYEKLQVPQQLAVRRYGEFVSIWKDLTVWSETLRK
jgi:hypothetical protein